MKRILFKSLKKHLDKKEFTILTGARQTGKSTLLKQLEDDCKQSDIPTVFLNLENKSILAELNKSPLALLFFLPEVSRRIIVFIDEIQYLDNPSNFLKLLYDEYASKLKIVATGSSAFYIDNNFKDSLAGRKRVFTLNTCSFDEYLLLRGKTELLDEVKRLSSQKAAKSALLAELEVEWSNYIVYGGYPAVVLESDMEDKKHRLSELKDSFVKRDILESGVKNETAFYLLFRILAGQSGNLLNINELSSTLRIKAETVENYLFILRKCHHIALIKPFYRNLRKELTKMPKAYLLDTGLRNCLLNNFEPLLFRQDKGALWENMYFRLLLETYPLDELFYWRTSAGNEVDFVVPNISNPYAVEVKYDQNTIKASKYKLFKENYPAIPLRYAYMNPFTEELFEGFPKPVAMNN
jgi:Predicted ATPase (AAA+ superfamily)